MQTALWIIRNSEIRMQVRVVLPYLTTGVFFTSEYLTTPVVSLGTPMPDVIAIHRPY